MVIITIPDKADVELIQLTKAKKNNTTNKTESDALAHVNSGTWGYNMTHIDCKGAAKDDGHSTHSSKGRNSEGGWN
jgi:hypothetical protein